MQMLSALLSVYFLGKCDGAPPLSPAIWFACGCVGERETLRWPCCVIGLPMTSWGVSWVKLLLAASRGCCEEKKYSEIKRGVNDNRVTMATGGSRSWLHHRIARIRVDTGLLWTMLTSCQWQQEKWWFQTTPEEAWPGPLNVGSVCPPVKSHVHYAVWSLSAVSVCACDRLALCAGCIPASHRMSPVIGSSNSLTLTRNKQLWTED